MIKFFPFVYALLAIVLFCLTPNAETTHLTIYHTSDLHDTSTNLSQIAHFVKKKKELKSAVLFLDTGDWFNKGDLTPLNTRGEAMASMIGASGYDAVVLGNHDHEYGTPRLVELINRFSLPVLAANIIWPATISPSNPPPAYNLFKFGDLRVAVIGTGSPSRNHSMDRMLILQPPAESIQLILDPLAQYSDILILMTHLGDNADLLIAKKFPQVDLIVGGHDHHPYPSLRYADASPTAIQHSGSQGKTFGEIILTWDGEKITHKTSKIITVTPQMPKLEAVESIRQSFITKDAEKPFLAR